MANKPNHVGAGDGADVVALPVRPRTLQTAMRLAMQP
jgi:hypothetical protein